MLEVHVVGAGGLAREVAQILVLHGARSGLSLAGFIGADPVSVGAQLGPSRIVGTDAWLRERTGSGALLGIGTPSARARVAAVLEGAGLVFPNLIDPSATIDLALVTLGHGNVVMPGARFTCDITVGDHCHFNLNVTVGHDARIGSHVVVNPGANLSGGVSVGDRVLLGTGCQVLEGRAIGAGATIGAGAVVTRDVPPGVTVVGVPARSGPR